MYYVINTDGTVAQKTPVEPSRAFKARHLVVETDEAIDIGQVVWTGSAFAPRPERERTSTAERSQQLQGLRDAVALIPDVPTKVALERLLDLLRLA